jgi:hypothetical protein
MVYSCGTAMERIQPMLRGVQDAPLEFFYKSDVVALMTECLIKAIEAHMYIISTPPPAKPKSKERVDLEQYAALRDPLGGTALKPGQHFVDLLSLQGYQNQVIRIVSSSASATSTSARCPFTSMMALSRRKCCKRSDPGRAMAVTSSPPWLTSWKAKVLPIPPTPMMAIRSWEEGGWLAPRMFIRL